jgi:aspartyl protease family protein
MMTGRMMQNRFKKSGLAHFRTVPLVLLAGCCFAQGALAASVGVVGLFKGKAMVSIEGGAPKLMEAGQTLQGVKLLSADSDAAVFEVEGKRRSLGMGQSFAATGNSGAGKPTVLLAADSQGHFASIGAINGNSVNFLVDTGASSVTLQASDAKRMGLDYKSGQRIGVNTANGVIPAWNVTLNAVRVGGITLYGVEGLVIETQMPGALLGMSFLNRTDMRREGQTMMLTQRY